MLLHDVAAFAVLLFSYSFASVYFTLRAVCDLKSCIDAVRVPILWVYILDLMF